ncbi:hypothetical protein BUALT_Bualt05G0060200 [Buddleja alternifolia]|uniref:Uncharacterized protein n=1 Tax=Buddleja alternifolia TaxID=168488 RepID=A0AAV6XIJ3_9LAMI|nr:hypothetical protein BUALT_Bualt05G0060200 [Buddleja alternifolia]
MLRGYDRAMPESTENARGCPCTVFKMTQKCCHSGPCRPTNLSRLFKTRCRDAFTYPEDDPTSTFTSSAGTNYSGGMVPPEGPLEIAALYMSGLALAGSNACTRTASSCLDMLSFRPWKSDLDPHPTKNPPGCAV